MDNLVERIKQQYPELTKAQKAVAAYVIDHFREIPFLKITAMAEDIGVSDTTIINFCVTLGFEGFGSFKKTIAGQIHAELNTVSKLAVHTDEPHDQSTLSLVLEQDIQNLQATLARTENQRNFDALLSLIDRAEKIYVIGFRSSALLAQLLAFNMRQQNRDIRAVIPGLGDYFDLFPLVTPKDLAIAIAFPRYSSGTIASMRHLKQKGVPVALITDTRPSDALQYSDVTLCCSVQSNTFVDSYVACVSLLNAITTACAINRKAKTGSYLKELEQLFNDFSAFLQ